MFSKRLKQLRKHRKISMQEMGDRLGLAKSTYAGYESGYRQPTLETIHTIAKLLSTSSDYLLGLTDSPDPKEPSNNMKEIFRSQQLHWDGVPLEEEDLELVSRLLERVLQLRSVKDANQEDRSDREINEEAKGMSGE